MSSYTTLSSIEQLDGMVANKLVEFADLSELNLRNYSFENCRLHEETFVKEDGENEDRTLRNVNFKNAHLDRVTFDGAVLSGCDFDGVEAHLQRTSFRNCTLNKCRFRETHLEWCDFRYVEINSATFESADIHFCDFYRAFFMVV